MKPVADSRVRAVTWSATMLLAVLCIGLGVWLAIRPFAATETLIMTIGVAASGFGALAALQERPEAAWLPWIQGAGWLLLGIVLLLWPGIGVDLLPAVFGTALIVHGALEVGTVLARRTRTPVVDLLGGVAAFGTGLLAILWPDATVLLVSEVFAGVVVLFGLFRILALLDALRSRTHDDTRRHASPQRRQWHHPLLHGIACAAAVVLVVVGLNGRENLTPVPAFYDWTAPVPEERGALLRAEETSQGVPADARGWRILYSTRDSDDMPVVGSALILVDESQVDAQHELLLWVHGTEGIARSCAPSLKVDATASMPAPGEALAQGWAIVAPDYPGAGTESESGYAPYLIGAGEAYSALDAARAAQQLSELALSNRIVVWGHSQGGGAALWTGYYAPDYAPDLDVLAVAALSPATELVALAESVDGHAAGAIVTAYTIVSYSTTYDDVDFDEYVRPGARAQARGAADRCLSDPSLLLSGIEGIGGQSIFRKSLSEGAFGTRLRENTPSADVGGVPLFIGQGTGDEVISFSITEDWAAAQCDAGYAFDLRSYPGKTHMGVLQDDDSALSSELIEWTRDRFAGVPAPAANNCG